MIRETTLHLYHGKLKFSAGHFTIFSATHREALHGHNYSLKVAIRARVNDNGMTADYRDFKAKLHGLCEKLNRRFLLPKNSPHLKLESQGEHIHLTFNGKHMTLLQEDVLILPLANITLEELSHWFVMQLKNDEAFIRQSEITAITIEVFNGLEQSAQASWEQ